tara:strand:+ start:560 stop:754 length:195 start_codon:yes stop_codon:yes gene_type:complete
MKATCPNGCKSKKFITVAHVAEDWLVDEEGDFIDRIASQEVVADPDPGNTWQCDECGEEATVTT